MIQYIRYCSALMVGRIGQCRAIRSHCRCPYAASIRTDSSESGVLQSYTFSYSIVTRSIGSTTYVFAPDSIRSRQPAPAVAAAPRADLSADAATLLGHGSP